MRTTLLVPIAATAVVATLFTISFAGKRGEVHRGDEQPPRGPDVVAWYTGGGGTGLDMDYYGEVEHKEFVLAISNGLRHKAEELDRTGTIL